MEIKGIKFISCIEDGSGYASAARKNVLALHKLGVPVTITPISFEQARPNLGKEGEIIKSLINKPIDYNVVMMQTTPEFYAKYKERGKIFVSYTIWETDKLHSSWPGYINSTADVCMVGCDWNVDVFRKSGVTVPLFSVPHVMDTGAFSNIEPYHISGIKDSTYIFYFIGQWTERKNVLATIKSYWSAFKNGEDVALVMKVYRSDYSDSEKDAIRNTIRRLKKVCPMENHKHPPIYLILDMLSESEMLGLHKRGNCYLSLDRGEGFGLSTASSGAAGNPVIATGFGGATEYLKSDNSYLVDFVEVCCHGMPWSNWYSLDQYWAEASQKHAVELMKHVYENQEEAKQTGLKLQNHLKENFNYEVIGNKILDAIRSL
jgi:glycosyltransferase involved in cell wall biosynthesis